MIPGLSQILMGQTVKGVVLLIASWSLSLVLIGVLIWIASIIDGYMVGKVLQSGRPVGEWQFFPS
jgi:TM2 domain-containing membrane protein YozV